MAKFEVGQKVKFNVGRGQVAAKVSGVLEDDKYELTTEKSGSTVVRHARSINAA